MSDELPEGWAEAKFQDLTENNDGKRVPIKSTDRKNRKGNFPYYGASGIIDSIDDYLFDGTYLLIAEDGANLLSRSTPVAFLALGRFWVNNHAHVVQPRQGVELLFLQYFLNSRDLQDSVTGSAQPKLTQAALNNIAVPVPPLAEQRRIVEKVEALLGEVNTARAHLAKVPTILKRFRQSILSAACSGQLSTGSATEVVTKATSEDEEIPEGWQWRELQMLALPEISAICAGPFGTIFKAHDFRDEGIPIIFLRHVGPGEYRTTKPGFMDRAKWDSIFRPYSVWGGELLVAKLGDPPGCCAIYPKGIGPAMVTPDVIKMSVDETRACS